MYLPIWVFQTRSKASLTPRIHRMIRQRGLTQKEAAALLGVKAAAGLPANAKSVGQISRRPA
jgi:hypothetical protein